MMTVFDYLKGCIRVEGAEVFSVVLENRIGLDGGRSWEEISVQPLNYCMVEGPGGSSHTFY